MSAACSTVCPGIGRTMLCILLLSGFCSCFYNYYLITEPKTWLEAQKYCRENYLDLASVDNMEDMERLVSAAASGYEGKAWIGLYDVIDRWQWAFRDEYFYGHNQWFFRNWQEGQPDDTMGFGKLCVLFQQGFWFDNGCNEANHFVCFQKIPYTKMTWDNALAHCRTYHTDLASVRNGNENSKILQVAGKNRVWIGLYRNIWSWWSDGTRHAFRYWANGHPEYVTESCAASVINATQLGKWVGNDCNEKLHFVCHNNKMKLFRVKLKALKTTVDLNVPAVTDAILNQIKEKLMKEGITRDLNIFWIKPGKNIFHKEEENADAVEVDL